MCFLGRTGSGYNYPMNWMSVVPVLVFVLVPAACTGVEPMAGPGSSPETDGTERAPLSTKLDLPTIGRTVVPTLTPTPLGT